MKERRKRPGGQRDRLSRSRPLRSPILIFVRSATDSRLICRRSRSWRSHVPKLSSSVTNIIDMLAQPLLAHGAELDVAPPAVAAEQPGRGQHGRTSNSGEADRDGPIHGKKGTLPKRLRYGNLGRRMRRRRFASEDEVLPLLNRASASPDAPRRGALQIGFRKSHQQTAGFRGKKWSLVGQCAV